MSQLTEIKNLTQEKTDLSQVLESVPAGNARAFIESRLNEISEMLLKIKKNTADYVNLMNFLFNSEVSEIKTSTITLYKPKIALTYAPPQVGKTNAIIEIVKDCIANNVSIVISSDNKKDQMSQLFKRLTRAVEMHYESIFENCFITTVDNKNFDSIVEEMKNKKSFIICCLDNKSQIQKVYEKVNAVQTVTDLCLIHDEADVITKARNINEVMANQPESHKKWIEFTTNLYNKGVNLKRVFVTATPENVVYLYKPGFVWELPIPENYVSASSIDFNELDNFDTTTITRILTREVKMRKDEGGIILYCVERNKDETNDEDTTSNQSQVFSGILKNIKKTGLDVVSSYNSNGFKLAFRLQKHKTFFMNKMEEKSIQYTLCEDEKAFTIRKNELSISEFYGYLQLCGCKVVLTIGKDLIARGISFVSNQTENPLTATTMIYKPGSQLSQVALTQAIGRLNGTAQPNLKRRLYTTDDVYTNYTTFVKNQKEIISSIRENGNKVDEDLIGDIALWKASRPVDRKILKLEQDMTFWEETEEDSGYTTDDDDNGVRMQRLIGMWWGADTIIGKILRFVYENENGVSENKLKDYIESTGSKNVNQIYIHLTRKDKDYSLIFERTENETNLKKEAREHIDNL
jgi:hypothetical protein